jgi:hypothetical protein
VVHCYVLNLTKMSHSVPYRIMLLCTLLFVRFILMDCCNYATLCLSLPFSDSLTQLFSNLRISLNHFLSITLFSPPSLLPYFFILNALPSPLPSSFPCCCPRLVSLDAILGEANVNMMCMIRQTVIYEDRYTINEDVTHI